VSTLYFVNVGLIEILLNVKLLCELHFYLPKVLSLCAEILYILWVYNVSILYFVDVCQRQTLLNIKVFSKLHFLPTTATYVVCKNSPEVVVIQC